MDATQTPSRLVVALLLSLPLVANAQWQERSRDLIARMTLKEKISQLGHDSPAIARLGIPAYNWWNEALHGVARAGRATVYPQAIGLAATWDPDLMHRVASSIADEARAKHGAGIYRGLTFFSPNINLFRDPRWGRGMETYGEDPFLTGTLAAAFIRGMQGDDPLYLKTAVTAKHFAVHSGPESLRHDFDAIVSAEDLRDSYLPQFKMAVEAGVASVMCAYNRVNGEPACASETLLASTLRRDWGFQGYVVSDCWALSDIQAPTRSAAVARALQAGTDLACGPEYQDHLYTTVQNKLVDEADIDRALLRLLQVRFRLGLIDGVENPYSKIRTFEPNRALALEAAQKSIVLLKNDGQTLPLSKRLRRIAVIGPNADDEPVLLGNYNGYPDRAITPLAGIREKFAGEVRYAQGSGLAEGVPVLVTVPLILQWDSLHRRGTGKLIAPATGLYSLGAEAQGEFELFIDDERITGGFDVTERGSHYVTIPLEQGRHYAIRVALEGDASIRLVWSVPNPNRLQEAVATAEWADAVVLCLGLSPRLEGEEMDINVPGFAGGDRTDIALPAEQQRLLESVLALGKPTVLVLINGSAVTWGDLDVPAVVEAWYPGQEGGTAIADVLFGDTNPGGRLPVTFYRSVADLPDFRDYSMANRTYRYFKGDVLYPFGYGLSFTTFSYSNDKPGEVTLTNTGSRTGDEVVQFYDEHLVGFQRVTLAPMESKQIIVSRATTESRWQARSSSPGQKHSR